MKKTLLLILFSIFVLSTQAQWFSLGVRGGYSVTLEKTQSLNEVIDIKNNLQNGFHAGVFMRMGRTLYVQPEILFNYYNYSINNEQNFPNLKNYNINTIDIPVLLGVSLVNKKMFKIRLMAGPKFHINVGSTVADTFQDIETFTQELRNARLGLDCGIGFDIWKLTLDVRYNLVQDLYKYQSSEGITLNNGTLNSIQASVGFRLLGNNNKKAKALKAAE